MAYDFTKFSPQSFERFAQALVVKALGNGVQVYGAGPDGGREASYNGRLEISTHGAQWDGYVVVQAKHRGMPKGGSDDAAWLERELAADLDKFVEPSRGLQKPDYYLAITNVTLTSVQSTSAKGGQQKIEDFFQRYQAPLGLRGWLVWHADTLSAMLDDYEGIRTR